MSGLKRQVDSYVDGMKAAAEKSRSVDAAGEFVESVPDAGVERLAHGVLFFLGGEFTFADSDGQEFTLKLSSDAVKCFSCGAHGSESTSEVTR